MNKKKYFCAGSRNSATLWRTSLSLIVGPNDLVFVWGLDRNYKNALKAEELSGANHWFERTMRQQ